LYDAFFLYVKVSHINILAILLNPNFARGGFYATNIIQIFITLFVKKL